MEIAMPLFRNRMDLRTMLNASRRTADTNSYGRKEVGFLEWQIQKTDGYGKKSGFLQIQDEIGIKKKHFSIQYYKVITFPFYLFVHIFVIIYLTLYLKLYSSISVKSFTNFVHLNIHFLLDQTQKPIENSVVTFKAMVITQTKIN